MTPRGLPCGAGEVRGFIDGRKTMFRVPVKPQVATTTNLHTQDLDEVERQGGWAYTLGVEPEANPYPPETIWSEAWREGYFNEMEHDEG